MNAAQESGQVAAQTTEFVLIDIDPIGFTHLRAELLDATDEAKDVPLCFVAETKRSGSTAADLNLTFDQALDIEDFPRTDDRLRVSCPDCREWIYA